MSSKSAAWYSLNHFSEETAAAFLETTLAFLASARAASLFLRFFAFLAWTLRMFSGITLAPPFLAGAFFSTLKKTKYDLACYYRQ